MLCGYLPFEGENNDELFKNILICKPELPDFLSEKAKKLIIKILNPNPDERIYIDEIKKDDFYLMGKELSNIDYDTIEKSIINNRIIPKNQDIKNTIKNCKNEIYDYDNKLEKNIVNNNNDKDRNINHKKENNNNSDRKKDNSNINHKKDNNNYINNKINKKDSINGKNKDLHINNLNKKIQILNNNIKSKKNSKKIMSVLQTDSILHNRNLSVNHIHNHSNSVNSNISYNNKNNNNLNIQTRNKKRNYVFSATSIKKTKNEIQTINNGFFREFSPKYSLKELIEMKKNKKNLRLLNNSNLVFHNLNFNHNSLNEGSKNKIIKTTLNSFEHQLILSKKNRLKKSVSNNSKKNNNNKSTNQNNSNINKKRNLNLFMNNITSNIKINKRKKNSINGSIISNISINTNPNFSNIHSKSSSRDEKYIPKTTRKEMFNQFKFIKYHF